MILNLKILSGCQPSQLVKFTYVLGVIRTDREDRDGYVREHTDMIPQAYLASETRDVKLLFYRFVSHAESYS
jgi:hypothetical protein